MARRQSYGHRTVTEAIEERLGELFPNATGVDFGVVASDLADLVATTAVATINARERDLQAAMQNLLNFYGELMGDLQGRIQALEGELANAKAALNREADLVEVASR